MANVMHLSVNDNNDLLNANIETNVDNWFLMGSPVPMLCIAGIYLSFVLKIGPKTMEKRPAFQLHNLLILYNALQVIFSIYLSYMIITQIGFGNIFTSLQCNISNPRTSDYSVKYAILSNAWWYFFGKFTELLDTVFFVLRKKQNQVTFLHVWHHTVTFVFSWGYLKYLPGEQGAIIACLNSTVHIVMYSYYLIAALGPHYQKYLWWKKYMTWMQLIQFAIMLGFLLTILVMDCKVPKTLSYFFLTNVVIFMYLFGDFYRKSYKKKQV